MVDPDVLESPGSHFSRRSRRDWVLWALPLLLTRAPSHGLSAVQHLTAVNDVRATLVTFVLALSSPGVTCQRVPGATGYPYACTGLRLLYVQSGTYDLLPVRWTSQGGQTIILDDSNQIRIELFPGS